MLYDFQVMRGHGASCLACWGTCTWSPELPHQKCSYPGAAMLWGSIHVERPWIGSPVHGAHLQMLPGQAPDVQMKESSDDFIPHRLWHPQLSKPQISWNRGKSSLLSKFQTHRIHELVVWSCWILGIISYAATATGAPGMSSIHIFTKFTVQECSWIRVIIRAICYQKEEIFGGE